MTSFTGTEARDPDSPVGRRGEIRIFEQIKAGDREGRAHHSGQEIFVVSPVEVGGHQLSDRAHDLLGDQDDADQDERRDDPATLGRVEAALHTAGKQTDQPAHEDREHRGQCSAEEDEEDEEGGPAGKRADQDAERGAASRSPVDGSRCQRTVRSVRSVGRAVGRRWTTRLRRLARLGGRVLVGWHDRMRIALSVHVRHLVFGQRRPRRSAEVRQSGPR